MIGIIDSGIGGVTVLKEILKVIPNGHYIYYSDSFNNPYGDKSKLDLLNILSEIVIFLKNKGCSIIVLACNTASCVCAKELREKFKDITFIAIEPAYKMVYDYNPLGKTLVMATKGTIESEKFQKLYLKYNNNNTILYPALGLASLIEEGNTLKIEEYLKTHILKFKGVSNVVLGCTHYPLIKDMIRKYLGDVVFFDGARGVSLELKRQIEKKEIKLSFDSKIEFYDSSVSDFKRKRFFEILN